MRAVIYIRVSTSDQVANFSLDTQEQHCRAYCKQHGYDVVRVFRDEGESAKTTARREFQEMLRFCRQNRDSIDVVVVYALSRFSRNSLDHQVIKAQLMTHGITLRSVTEPIDESATGKLMENIASAFAQYDNNLRAERTKVGMIAKLQAGGWPFKAPLGYREEGTGRDSTLVHDLERVDLVRRGFELVASGVHGVKAALDTINSAGLRTRKGNRVSLQTLNRMLRNPVYCGWVAVSVWSERHRAAFEPIISEELFGRVQAVLSGKKAVVAAHDRNNRDFPLRRFVRCGRCGIPLTGSWSTGRTIRYAYYHCRARGCGVRVDRAQLERQFLELLETVRPRPEYLRLFREVVLRVWREKEREADAIARAAEQRVEGLKQKRAALVDAFVYSQALSKVIYTEEMARLEEEMTVARIEVSEATFDQLDVEAVVAFAEYVITHAGRLWLEFDLDQKQRLQRVVFPEGLRFSDGGFRTAATNTIFTGLRAVEHGEDELASPTGFEP